jgi:hypothetical protein
VGTRNKDKLLAVQNFDPSECMSPPRPTAHISVQVWGVPEQDGEARLSAVGIVVPGKDGAPVSVNQRNEPLFINPRLCENRDKRASGCLLNKFRVTIAHSAKVGRFEVLTLDPTAQRLALSSS